MTAAKRRLLTAALCAAAGAGLWGAHGGVPYFAPSAARYTTACVAIDSTTVEGFLTNDGAGLIQISGFIRYGIAGDMVTRPLVQVQTNVLIPPGITMSLGRARLPAALLPGETCVLDVSAALK